MKRVGLALLLSGLVVSLWFCSVSLSGGQEHNEPRLDQGFCADANGDGQVNISDAVTILSYLFTGGAPPYCVAQNVSLDDLFVNEGQGGAVTTDMLADWSVTPAKLDGCELWRTRNLCQEIDWLMAEVSTLQGTVSTLQGTVSTLQGTVSTLQGTVDEINRGNIAACSS